ncbi:hypothetical protein D0T84_00735, partial [Dysgonomonas sp. 521]|uniref:hypothetical protein n=1 Tax=Dysgonomonas sp. 521 TaxID=2302932 RepID=UPI0013CFC085
MVTNIENLEFKEITDITITEQKEGFHAIGYDSVGNDKAYPLGNLITEDEVDKKLRSKAENKELEIVRKDINTLKSTKADQFALNTTNSEVEDLKEGKLDKTEFEDYKDTKQHDKGYFSTEEALIEAHPSPVAGDNANVAGIMYECKSDGIWISTGQAAPTPELYLGEYVKKEDIDLQASQCLRIISNSEYLFAIIDASTAILCGFRRNGEIYVAKGMPEDTKAALKLKLNYTDVVNV